MKTVVNHETYGEIVYDENFWTGKKTISINGVVLQKISKKDFSYTTETGTQTVSVKGNFLSGVKLNVANQTIVISDSAKWYEYVLAVLGFVFILVWGSSVELCKIFPVVGGAIGGGISGGLAVVSLFVMRKTKKTWLKIVIGIAFIALTILICYLIGIVIINSLK